MDWYELKPKEAKVIIITMCASKDPFDLTAGKFFVLSMERFITVLLAFLSFITFTSFSTVMYLFTGFENSWRIFISVKSFKNIE